ncbi:hypothetical protein DID77_01110 [Candidatus Marinamargulisbacteria bacterium SCGC AG-439-L15]|nr:hypothetical protein DID77_01110 [Candidatus Marinamargulisbacteria bacterium SCGC AG-439-L15]
MMKSFINNRAIFYALNLLLILCFPLFMGCGSSGGSSNDDDTVVPSPSATIVPPPLWQRSFGLNSPHTGPALTSEVLWNIETPHSIAIDASNNVYLSKSSGGFYVYSSDRTELFELQSHESFSSPTIADDGTIYVGNQNDTLYRIKRLNNNFTYEVDNQTDSFGPLITDPSSNAYAKHGTFVSSYASTGNLTPIKTINLGCLAKDLSVYNNQIFALCEDRVIGINKETFGRTFTQSSLRTGSNHTLHMSLDVHNNRLIVIDSGSNSRILLLSLSDGSITQETTLTGKTISHATADTDGNIYVPFVDGAPLGGLLKFNTSLTQVGTTPAHTATALYSNLANGRRPFVIRDSQGSLYVFNSTHEPSTNTSTYKVFKLGNDLSVVASQNISLDVDENGDFDLGNTHTPTLVITPGTLFISGLPEGLIELK